MPWEKQIGGELEDFYSLTYSQGSLHFAQFLILLSRNAPNKTFRTVEYQKQDKERRDCTQIEKGQAARQT